MHTRKELKAKMPFTSTNGKSSYNQVYVWKIILVAVFLPTKKTIAINKSLTIKNITIGGLFSLNGTNAAWGDCLIAAKFAINHINNDSRILHGYRLNLSWGNAQVLLQSYSKGIFIITFTKPSNDDLRNTNVKNFVYRQYAFITF